MKYQNWMKAESLRLGSLTGCEQRELGAEPAQVVDHAVTADALRGQQLAEPASFSVFTHAFRQNIAASTNT